MIEKIKDIFQNKIEKLNLESHINDDNMRIMNQYFPPFSSVITIYNFRIRIYKIFLCILLFTLITVFIVEEYRVRKMINVTLNKDIIVLPVPNFMKVRAGEISDDVLFSFSDWVVKQLESFDYVDVDSQYHELEKYMNPEMRAKFIFEKKSKIDKYKKLAVVQYITFNKPQKIYQKIDKNGESYFEVTYNGTIQRFTDDQKLKPIEEIFTLKFTTSSLENTNRKWIFDIKDIQRQYSESPEIQSKISSQM